MTDLDTRLRTLAHDALDRAAADVPVDDDLAEVRARVGTRPVAGPEAEGTWPWHRLAVAAALVALVGGAITILATRDGGEELVAPPVTEPIVVSTTVETTIVSTSADATTSVPLHFVASLAVADPALVAPGWTVSITPAGEVRRTCLDIVSVAANTADGLVHSGLVLNDGWDTSTPPTLPACLGERSAGPVEVRVPAELEHGEYRFCLAGDDEPAGCAMVQVASVTTTTEVPSTLVPGLTVMGTAEPRPAAQGTAVQITPPGPTLMRCRGDAVVYATIPSLATTPVAYIDRSAGLVDAEQLDICDYDESSDPVTVTIPAELAPGEYVFCIGSAIPLTEPDRQVCAHVEVEAAGIDAGATELPVGYVERVYVEEPPYFGLREIGPDGTVIGEAGDGAIADLLRREVVAGDWTLRLLEEEQPYGRCDNRQVAAAGPAPDATPEADAIGLVRSLAATADGVLVVGVDVCPEGAQWGDEGTRFELRRVDLRDGSTTVLHTRLPGDGDTFFEDQDVVYAGGEFVVESVSPDGAFVAVAEPYTTEDTRYHLFDAVTGGDPIELGSSCDDPGDLAGPPRFVGDGLVVVARECSAPEFDIGDLVVELASLDTLEPLWSVEVQSVAIDSYSSTVSLSATVVDGEVWALVSGSPGVEQPITAAAVTDGIEQPLPVASIVAFTPEELIEPWDPYPS